MESPLRLSSRALSLSGSGRDPGKMLLLVGGVALLLFLLYPYLVLIGLLSFVGGFLGIPLLEKRISGEMDKDLPGSAEESSALTDPLSLHSAQVAEDKRKEQEKVTPSFRQIQMPKVSDLDLKVDPRLDSAIAAFVSSVFDYYISPSWAPYLTRRQLKLSFKQLLTRLGERVNLRLKENPTFFHDLCKRKVIPLMFQYLRKVQKEVDHPESADLIFPPEKKRVVNLKVRRLCKEIILQCMPFEEEKKCRLWVDLCVAVLSDGVFWNVFNLGKDHIPEVLEVFLKEWIGQLLMETENFPRSAEAEDEVDVARTKNCSEVSFLLDSFLDRKDSLEQPDPIVSRWRPSLKEITEETELLYPLIHYLKHVGGQTGLVLLQAVLDDSPDAKEHCKRVLEVEYLPGFCRSNIFHESMGLSRVEQGTEVVTEGSPGLSRRRPQKGHSRSASYGSKSNQGLSDILRIDGVVEGLPIYNDNSDAYSSLSSATSGIGSSTVLSSEISETDSFFRRKPQMEDLIAKFMKTTAVPHSGSKESSPKRVVAPRIGTDGKSYKEWDDPEIWSRVQVHPDQCDIMQSLMDLILLNVSSTSSYSWLFPILSSWMTLLHPILKPLFDHKLDDVLNSNLNLDLFVKCVDLITDAFNGMDNPDSGSSNNRTSSSSSSANPSSQAFDHVTLNHQRKSMIDLIVQLWKVLDVDKFLASLKINRDYIFLFFVDALDLLVYEILGDAFDCDTDRK